jgi:hypothetical protein
MLPSDLKIKPDDNKTNIIDKRLNHESGTFRRQLIAGLERLCRVAARGIWAVASGTAPVAVECSGIVDATQRGEPSPLVRLCKA